jgi:hypothetical protein
MEAYAPINLANPLVIKTNSNITRIIKNNVDIIYIGVGLSFLDSLFTAEDT